MCALVLLWWSGQVKCDEPDDLTNEGCNTLEEIVEVVKGNGRSSVSGTRSGLVTTNVTSLLGGVMSRITGS